jgi:hypothetical protein
MTVANDLRSLSDQGTITTSWGIRHQIKVARSLKWFSAVAAFALATDDMSPDEADVVLESVRSAFKEK